MSNSTITFTIEGGNINEAKLLVIKTTIAAVLGVPESKVTSDFQSDENKTELQKFVEEFAHERGIANYTAIARLSKEIGVSHRTLERWAQKGIPDKRNTRGVEQITALMAA